MLVLENNNKNNIIP